MVGLECEREREGRMYVVGSEKEDDGEWCAWRS